MALDGTNVPPFWGFELLTDVNTILQTSIDVEITLW